MSNESQMETQNQDGGGEDLSMTLSSQEGEFVPSEEQKPGVSQGMLYLLLLIVVGAGGTFYMYKKQGPSAASAASVETAQAQQTIDTFLTQGPAGIKMMEQMLHNTEKIVHQFLEYPSVPQIPLSELQTNPFRFAKAETAAANDEDQAQKKRDAERAAAMKASQTLSLQSIIHSGTRRACMINNAMYQEGQQISTSDDSAPQFIVEKIGPAGVIVKTGAYRFELRMQK